MAAPVTLLPGSRREWQNADPVFIQSGLCGLSQKCRVDVFRDGIIAIESQQFSLHPAGENTTLGLSAYTRNRASTKGSIHMDGARSHDFSP